MHEQPQAGRDGEGQQNGPVAEIGQEEKKSVGEAVAQQRDDLIDAPVEVDEGVGDLQVGGEPGKGKGEKGAEKKAEGQVKAAAVPRPEAVADEAAQPRVAGDEALHRLGGDHLLPPAKDQAPQVRTEAENARRHPAPQQGVDNEADDEGCDKQAEATRPDLHELPAGPENVAQPRVGRPPEQTADDDVKREGPRAHAGIAGDVGDEGTQETDEAADEDALAPMIDKEDFRFLQQSGAFAKNRAAHEAGAHSGAQRVAQGIADNGAGRGHHEQGQEKAFAVGGQETGKNDQYASRYEYAHCRQRFEEGNQADHQVVYPPRRQPAENVLKYRIHGVSPVCFIVATELSPGNRYGRLSRARRSYILPPGDARL